MDARTVCPICTCGEQEPLPYPRAQETARGLIRCVSCHYVYQAHEPPPVASAGLPLPETRLPEALLTRWLALIENAVGRGALLDIGCGTGRFLDLARQHGWRVSGVASTNYSSAPARLDDGATVHPTLAEGLWPAGSFDAVTIWNALDRVQQPEDLLRLAGFYCRVDGVLVVHTLNSEGIPVGSGDDERTARWYGRTVRLYSPSALQRLLGRYGFRIERLERGDSAEGVSTRPHHGGHPRDEGGRPARSAAMRHTLAPHALCETLTVTARYVP